MSPHPDELTRALSQIDLSTRIRHENPLPDFGMHHFSQEHLLHIRTEQGAYSFNGALDEINPLSGPPTVPPPSPASQYAARSRSSSEPKQVTAGTGSDNPLSIDTDNGDLEHEHEHGHEDGNVDENYEHAAQPSEGGATSVVTGEAKKKKKKRGKKSKAARGIIAPTGFEGI
jgi:hypothetical protein